MNEDQKYQAVTARDAAHDGEFYYGVMTTGVYCRPSCGSRQPLRKNVRFYDNPAAAERDGLRPCKRCKPLAKSADETTVRRMRELCAYIRAHAGDPLTLAALGNQAHLSPFHLQRSFKAVLGVSPKDFIEACRLDALKAGLRKGGDVSGAIYDAGYGSASRVYERSAKRLGMTPRQYRAGGAGVAISHAVAQTPLGLLMMAASDRGLCFVQFGDDEAALRKQLRTEYPGAQLSEMPPRSREPFALWMRALGAHLADARRPLDLPLDLRGTAFQMRVWNYLLKIPVGELRSYAEVAQGIGAPRAVRAVASACAANRVGIVVPCHRVIRGDGGLGGYRWGPARKRSLIDAERAAKAAP